MNRVTRWIAEQWPVPYIPWQLRQSWAALRTTLNEGLLNRPSMQNTRVDYELARALYRNHHSDYNLGAGFVKPIIDLSVEYVGLPFVTTEEGERDTFLNECIHDHWAPQLAEIWRDAMRDGKTIMRYRQPRIDNPLFTEEDRMHGKIESVPPEMADLTFAPDDPDFIERAVFTHYIDFDERTDEEVLRGDAPRMREHEIHEVITPTAYRFYDKTDDKMLESWATRNTWGFVPAWPIYNDWDAALASGQSDIESVFPFVDAFHQVLKQALLAHKYHSSPKAKVKVKDVLSFLVNNYPDTVDPNTGRIVPGAKISWSGNEIFLLDTEEDVEFIEMSSALGDSKTLLDFLIDCIAISAETPKWALLKTDVVNMNDASVTPFEKKIARKRTMLAPVIIMLCKMNLASRKARPVTVRVTWPAIRIADLAAKGQAIQQIIMAFDVASAHEWVADATVVQILGTMFPEFNSPEVEMQRAKSNVTPEIPAPAPASTTQGSQNGSGSKSSAKKAVSTTKASNS